MSTKFEKVGLKLLAQIWRSRWESESKDRLSSKLKGTSIPMVKLLAAI